MVQELMQVPPYPVTMFEPGKVRLTVLWARRRCILWLTPFSPSQGNDGQAGWARAPSTEEVDRALLALPVGQNTARVGTCARVDLMDYLKDPISMDLLDQCPDVLDQWSDGLLPHANPGAVSGAVSGAVAGAGAVSGAVSGAVHGAGAVAGAGAVYGAGAAAGASAVALTPAPDTTPALAADKVAPSTQVTLRSFPFLPTDQATGVEEEVYAAVTAFNKGLVDMMCMCHSMLEKAKGYESAASRASVVKCVRTILDYLEETLIEKARQEGDLHVCTRRVPALDRLWALCAEVQAIE